MGHIVDGAIDCRIEPSLCAPPGSSRNARAIDMKMFTVPDRRPMQPSDYTGPWDYQMYRKQGEGIMPGRGLAVSGFHTKGQALSWDFKVYEPGRYQVAVVCHVNKGRNWNADGRVRVNVAGQSVENQLIESKRVGTITMPQHFLEVYSIIGTVKIEALRQKAHR